jgi:hypothetical protein
MQATFFLPREVTTVTRLPLFDQRPSGSRNFCERPAFDSLAQRATIIAVE